jgi:hypothetical protein
VSGAASRPPRPKARKNGRKMAAEVNTFCME